MNGNNASSTKKEITISLKKKVVSDLNDYSALLCPTHDIATSFLPMIETHCGVFMESQGILIKKEQTRLAII